MENEYLYRKSQGRSENFCAYGNIKIIPLYAICNIYHVNE